MKTITIGDLHGKDYWKNIDIEKYDKVIFLGDYVDSFNESNDGIYNNLKEVIELKKDNPDKVVLIIGNHDLHYIHALGDIKVRCSGFRPEAYHDLHDLFNNNLNLFQVIYQHNNYIWLHAGIHKGWYKWSAQPEIMELGLENKTISEQITALYKYNKDSIFDVGYMRGGFKNVGGPFWVDKSLLSPKPLEHYHQIVGHNRIDAIKTINIEDNTSITYCDCLDNNIKLYELKL